MADHLRLDLNRVEDLQRQQHTSQSAPYPYPRIANATNVMKTHLAVVDANDGADHLRDDDHVTEVGLHDRGLFVGGRLLLSLAELLDEAHRLALEAALEPPAGTSVDDLKKIRV